MDSNGSLTNSHCTINIFEGSLKNPGDKTHEGLDLEQRIGAVAGHELEHVAQDKKEISDPAFDAERNPKIIENKIIKESKEK